MEHHAETLDDMSLKSDKRWKASPAAKALDADTYRGTAFSWKVFSLMTLQMLPTAIPCFMMIGFSFFHTILMLIPALLLHGLVWNAIHPTMHGLQEVPLAFGPPSNILSRFTSSPYFRYIYKNHVGHHVVGGTAITIYIMINYINII